MALANGPDILIADEPTTALDVTVQARILDLLAEVQKAEGMAMLFITHNLGIVRRIADRVAVMQAGEIVETGPTARIFAEPSHPYTRKLLAAEPSGQPRPGPRRRPDGRRHRAPPRLVPDPPRPAPPHRRPHQGGQRRHRRDPRRRDPRRRRRVGLRQDHPRARHHAADLVRGPHRLPRPGHPGLEAPRAPPPAPRHADGVPGPLRLALPAHVGRPDRRRGPRRPRPRRRGRPRRRDPRRGRPRPRHRRPLPARVLRRPAPAHRHRPRDDPRAEARRPRRADLAPST